MNVVPSGESCLVCGDDLEIHTKADQAKAEGHGAAWWAFDGDLAKCPDCGFVGWVSVDDQIGSINWDETSEHNLKCAEQYEARGTGPATS